MGGKQLFDVGGGKWLTECQAGRACVRTPGKVGLSVKLVVRRKKKGINPGVETGEEAQARAVGVGPPSPQGLARKRMWAPLCFSPFQFSVVERCSWLRGKLQRVHSKLPFTSAKLS